MGILYDFKLERKVNKKLYHNLRDPVVDFLWWRFRAFQMSDYCQRSALQLMYRVQGVGSSEHCVGTLSNGTYLVPFDQSEQSRPITTDCAIWPIRAE